MRRRARVVIGSAFGDEGKGLMVDYFCRQVEMPIVARFNGGAQAGHTVVTPEGLRHVFHHYGAGTFAGAETFLGSQFLVNPVAWKQEFSELSALGYEAFLYIHGDAPVTTIYDMFLNQKMEESRTKRHGSCGMGIHETMVRQEFHPLSRLTAADLHSPRLETLVERIRTYTVSRLIHLGLTDPENFYYVNDHNIFSRFMQDCQELSEQMTISTEWVLYDRDIVFEGAQGLLLDAQNKRFYPHVTHSRTGLTNVLPIAQKLGLGALDVTYVARTYLTRHGAGELPHEDPDLSYEDTTNVDGPWQGKLRFAPQDHTMIKSAIYSDISVAHEKHATTGVKVCPNLAVTHCDQHEFNFRIEFVPTNYVSFGPTYKDVIPMVYHGEKVNG